MKKAKSPMATRPNSVKLSEADVKRIKAIRRRVVQRGGCSMSPEEFVNWLNGLAMSPGVWRCFYHFAKHMPAKETGFVTLADLQIDHRIPVSREGPGEAWNLIPCCGTCNRRKGSLTDVEFEDLCNEVNRYPELAQAYIWQKLGQAPRWKR
jgi:5-methylcytosine-specific restriction endonuclease McrA